MLRTRENSDVFNSLDEIYLVFTSKKQIYYIFSGIMGVYFVCGESLFVVLLAVMRRISLCLSQICFGSLDCKGTTVLSQRGSYTLLITCNLYVSQVCIIALLLHPCMT